MVREFVLDGAEAAFGDDDGLGEAVLGAAAIGVDEELEEAEAGTLPGWRHRSRGLVRPSARR